jgi:hypothetical protein
MNHTTIVPLRVTSHHGPAPHSCHLAVATSHCRHPTSQQSRGNMSHMSMQSNTDTHTHTHTHTHIYTLTYGVYHIVYTTHSKAHHLTMAYRVYKSQVLHESHPTACESHTAVSMQCMNHTTIVPLYVTSHYGHAPHSCHIEVTTSHYHQPNITAKSW